MYGSVECGCAVVGKSVGVIVDGNEFMIGRDEVRLVKVVSWGFWHRCLVMESESRVGVKKCC